MTTHQATECGSSRHAIEAARAEGRTALQYEGRPLVAGPELVAALERSGRPFAYLCEHDGRVVTIPVH